MVKITFPNGSIEEFPQEVTCLDIATKISPRLAKEALGAKINGKLVDLSFNITQDSQIQILTWKDPEGKEIFRHSSAHLLAQALTRMYPGIKLTIGPVVEEGFYYDIDSDKAFTPEDLKNIELEMEKLMKEDFPVYRIEVSKNDALKMFATNEYKIEMIEDMQEDETIISIYKQGEFFDLCRGPHTPRTGLIKAFKLTKVAGAYWRADAKNKQLQRIYGISFPEKKELDAYLKMVEEAEKRDHRKIGKELNLFMIHEYAPGIPFFLPKGMIMLIELTKFVREYSYGAGYSEVRSPQVFNSELWKESGHWEHYQEDMFIIHHAADKVDLGLKPMNCPGHMLIFRRDTHSYKDLPLRIAETTTLYRNEASGTLSGLTRVRSISQDDTHIFVTPEQIFSEIKILLDKINTIYKIFDLKIDEVHLSTRPEKYLGTIETWDQAEKNLKNALDATNMNYKINEGDGAFYGPKIDVKVKDALGRQWQLATIQLDYQLPQRFGLYYDDIDGSRKTPIVIHRALLGSLERFFGIMIEHFAGKFPLWLSPVQIKLLPIADRHLEYANKLKAEFELYNIRVEVDGRTESTGKKVRDAQLEKIPLMLTVGDREIEQETVAVRTLDGIVKFGVKKDEIINKIIDNVKKKSIILEI